MSMIGSFGLLSEDEITKLLEAPETVHELIHPERDIYQDERFHCVEKDWHAIHFLLNRKAWMGEPPLDFIVRGGTEVGDVDVGYGPARVFTPSELGRIVSALHPITDDMLRQNFTAEALAAADDHLYPGWGPGEEKYADEMVASYRGLQAFLEAGAKQGRGLIVWLD